ncbi:MAG: 6-pyruvoyl tetrahydropterin synthase family protein [Methanobrevibacter sp.]|uniref:6-pyruvoyl trahydropterin synthase family protein n=1 Tax=Methanobrevibacter sp. TaxID=66852 RepID=UPI0025F5DB50|nr:6-pyruvoyl tetrahydropterin synthase family protein [Methanobrevibacter sp.]MBR0271924.1 6-pyruvoyl tetrahydropterin synthase family protein [Methanobrevibacter sp.]
MKILVNGIQSNLRFSSAHVIPGHESCGFIHGHSYFVDVEIEGERAGEFEFVVDFKDVKKYTKAICDELDHRLLIPVYNSLIDFKDFNKEKDSIFDLKEEEIVSFKIDGKGYSVPSVDCVFLPLPYTSAEELSKFFAESLYRKLSETYDNLEYISVCVNEGIGQGAQYKKEFVE